MCSLWQTTIQGFRVKPTSFAGQTVVFAKHQREYTPLPAHISKDGVATFCWQLTWLERVRLLITGKLWHQVLTFNSPLQPQKLTTHKPEL